MGPRPHGPWAPTGGGRGLTLRGHALSAPLLDLNIEGIRGGVQAPSSSHSMDFGGYLHLRFLSPPATSFLGGSPGPLRWLGSDPGLEERADPVGRGGAGEGRQSDTGQSRPPCLMSTATSDFTKPTVAPAACPVSPAPPTPWHPWPSSLPSLTQPINQALVCPFKGHPEPLASPRLLSKRLSPGPSPVS